MMCMLFELTAPLFMSDIAAWLSQHNCIGFLSRLSFNSLRNMFIQTTKVVAMLHIINYVSCVC